MPRIPDPVRRRPIFWIAAALFALQLAAFGYLAVLNFRLGRELFDHQWKTPTEIYSNAMQGEPRLVAKLYGSDWRTTSPVEIATLPKHVPDAFIAAEDVRFRRHIGIDPIGITRALFANVRSKGVVQGGSTINQQLVKQKLLTNDRTFRRKLVEVPLAIMMDARMSKDEILEAYLNDVYLGHFNGRPILGIDEGAHLYFDKSAENLDVHEAAHLASLVRAPNLASAKKGDLAKTRRDRILETMQDRGWIEEEALERAKSRTVRMRAGDLPEQLHPHYFSALRAELLGVVSERILKRGGLKIYAEIDPKMQTAAEAAVRRGSQTLRSRYSWIRSQSRKDPLQAALLSVDPRTGGVRALVGGSQTDVPGFDRTRMMKRQPGSAFKPFAFLAAIASKEATTSTLLLDTPLKVELSRNDVWEPHNYDERYRGRVTLREAFEESLNVPTVRLTQEIGNGSVVRLAKSSGFEGDIEDIPALPLGVTDVSLRELTSAYTIFPNLGVRTEAFLLREIRDRNGKSLYKRETRPVRVVEPAPAYILHTLMQGVVRRGTAARLRRYGLSGMAGKTGTTSDYRDAWFVGYTPTLVTTVWVGFDRGAPLRLSSAEAAIPLWALYMRDVDRRGGEIARPEGVVERRIDPQSGYLWAEGCPGPVTEYYLSGTQPARTCPRGFLGRIVRRALFDAESFDEPAAITFDKFRRWSSEVDRQRQDVENTLDKVRRIFRDNGDDRSAENGKAARKARDREEKDREKREKREEKEEKKRRGRD
jgi:penicillin-binding protein 1B